MRWSILSNSDAWKVTITQEWVQGIVKRLYLSYHYADRDDARHKDALLMRPWGSGDDRAWRGNEAVGIHTLLRYVLHLLRPRSRRVIDNHRIDSDRDGANFSLSVSLKVNFLFPHRSTRKVDISQSVVNTLDTWEKQAKTFTNNFLLLHIKNKKTKRVGGWVVLGVYNVLSPISSSSSSSF